MSTGLAQPSKLRSPASAQRMRKADDKKAPVKVPRNNPRGPDETNPADIWVAAHEITVIDLDLAKHENRLDRFAQAESRALTPPNKIIGGMNAILSQLELEKSTPVAFINSKSVNEALTIATTDSPWRKQVLAFA